MFRPLKVGKVLNHFHDSKTIFEFLFELIIIRVFSLPASVCKVPIEKAEQYCPCEDICDFVAFLSDFSSIQFYGNDQTPPTTFSAVQGYAFLALLALAFPLIPANMSFYYFQIRFPPFMLCWFFHWFICCYVFWTFISNPSVWETHKSFQTILMNSVFFCQIFIVSFWR